MGTSANIVALHSSGRWGVTYVNYDGYPSGVGIMLHDHYTDQAKVDLMLQWGHMSELDMDPTAPEGHSYKTPTAGHSVYYGRDRGEEDVDTDYYDSFPEAWGNAQNNGGQYTYAWDGNAWHHKGKTISEAMVDEENN